MRWVPTRLRNPLKDGIYLVTDREQFVNADTRYNVMPLLWIRGRWNCGDEGNHGFAYPVIAWMPLPAAYKEKK